LEKALTFESSNTEALRARAAIAIELTDTEAATDYHRRYLAAGGVCPELAYNLGLLLQSAGDFARAAGCYESAVAQRPNFSEALLNLGHALKAIGNEEGAKLAWSKAVSANAGLAEAYFQ
jgi:tetratricopeptide (TPR) repeat protein